MVLVWRWCLVALAALGAGGVGAEPLKVTVTAVTQRSITLSWRTEAPTDAAILYGPRPNDRALTYTQPATAEDPARKVDPAEEWPYQVDWKEARVAGAGRLNSYTLKDLQPGTRYAFRVVPRQGEPSLFRVMATRPGAARMLYVTLPILVVVYTPITYQGLKPGQAPPAGTPPRLGEADLSLIRRHMATVRDFYWRNSGAKLDLDFHYATLDRRVEEKEGAEPSFESDADGAIRRLGKKAEDFVGAIFLYGWDEGLDEAGRAKIYRGAAFGGLTYGTDAPWKYKKTPYSWIHFNHNADITWTVVHEYHHQLDSLFDASGYPEYYFNHPDPDSPPGRFGEHFDVNAWILRSWPEQSWMGLAYGRVVVATDTDGDGLPDAADVALDENRFGSDPLQADTDGDGLSDLGEMMAFQGVTRGLDEEMGGPVVLPDPRHANPDGDGVPDGKDPYPLYAADPVRTEGTPRWEARLGEGGWRKLASMSNKGFRADCYLAWDRENLYYALRASRPVTLNLDLDAGNDGWFHGSDNYRLKVVPASLAGGERQVDVAIFDWDKFHAVPQVYVYWNREKVKASDLRVLEGRDGRWFVLKVAIPRNPATSLLLEPGRRMGLKPGLSWPGRPVERAELTFFGPHQLFQVRLARRLGAEGRTTQGAAGS
ncbi:MAG TPA: fibronectin type III domain-containing protein [Armatimonadota bacterium]|jgi:hypothetical protein